jgi:hypothetical protein
MSDRREHKSLNAIHHALIYFVQRHSTSLPTMDEGKQPLTEQEQRQLNAQAAISQAEAETGTSAIPRTANTEDPDEDDLDPRFDKVRFIYRDLQCSVC